LLGGRLSRLSQAWHYARAAAQDGRTPLFHLLAARKYHRRQGVGPQASYFYRLFDPTRSPEEKAHYIPDDVNARGGPASGRFQRRLTPVPIA
jgi:hypothetical protein